MSSYNDPLILSILACSVCGNDLKRLPSGDLICTCGSSIKFRDGIYYADTDIEKSESAQNTIENFGKRWNFVFERMGELRNYFLPTIQPVQKDFFADKIVVDGGGGYGRLTKNIIECGAKHVVLLDASDATLAAQQYLADYNDSVTIIKGDLLVPPIKSDSIDIFLCHGVLHHTGNPSKVLSNIGDALKPDTGSVLLWVYAKEGNEVLSKLIKTSQSLCSMLGDRGRWRIAEFLDVCFWTLTNWVYKPLNYFFNIKHQLFYGEYLIDFLYMKKISNRIDRVQMFHDFITTEIAEYYSESELRTWLRANGFRKISLVFYRKQSWSVAASFNEKEDFSGRTEF